MNAETTRLFVRETARAQLVAKNAWETYQHTKNISEALMEQSVLAKAAAEIALRAHFDAQLLAEHTQELFETFLTSIHDTKVLNVVASRR